MRASEKGGGTEKKRKGRGGREREKRRKTERVSERDRGR